MDSLSQKAWIMSRPGAVHFFILESLVGCLSLLRSGRLVWSLLTVHLWRFPAAAAAAVFLKCLLQCSDWHG